MTDSVLINVAIIPPVSVSHAIVALAARLPEDAPLRVDGVDRAPHLTVYMARFPVDHQEAVTRAVQSAVVDRTPMELRHLGFNLTEGRYYEVSYERSRALMRLQRSIIDGAASCRYRPEEPVRETYFGPYSSEQRRRAEKTGYDLAGRLYRPHITIGRLTPQGQTSNVPGIDANLSFRAHRLGLFLADEYGAARELVEHYDLQQ